MDTLEGNKLIAEFMGAEWRKDDYGDFGWYYASPVDFSNWWLASAVQYHTSWDWLLPVMHKICELGYTVQWTISDDSTCRIWPYLKTAPSCCIIEDRPWKAVVQFIQWYNTHITD